MATTFFMKVNFGRGTLNSGITDVATSMTLDAGHTLPQTSGDFRVAIYDAVTYPYPDDDINMEIVTANWTSGNTYTITRAQEGTTGVAHSAADRVSNMITGESLEQLETAINARTERASAEIVTGDWTFDGLFKWGDTSLDHDYILGVSELTADRTITLPLLTANDEFVFKDFIQTLTNKTINTAANTITVAEADIIDGSLLARVADSETITGIWRFNANIGLNTATFGASLAGGIAILLGAINTADVTDQIHMAVIDDGAGNAGLAIRSESGKKYFFGTNFGQGTFAPDAGCHINLQVGGPGSVPAGITDSISAIIQANVNTTDGCALYILGGTAGSSSIRFADSGNKDVGAIHVYHSTEYMTLSVGGGVRLRINSGGEIGIGQDPVTGSKLSLPLENDPVTPTLSFGDGNSGWYEQSDNVLILALAGVGSISFATTWFFSTSNAAGWAILDETPSATNPVFSFRGDTDTGLTRAGTDTVGLVAGGVSAIQYAEVGSSVLSTQQYDSGITAGTTQTQAGATQMDSSVNIVTSVPSANDGIKLPSAVIGVRVAVLNNGGANALLYPFLGDEIESLGVNSSMALLEGKGVELVAVSASRWSII